MSSEQPDKPWQMRGATPGFIEPSKYPTRMRAALAGMGRGAKIGFWIVAVLGWLIELAMVVLGGVLSGPEGRWTGPFAGVGELLMVSLVTTPLVALLCGSLPLAVLLGLIDARGWQGAEESAES